MLSAAGRKSEVIADGQKRFRAASKSRWFQSHGRTPGDGNRFQKVMESRFGLFAKIRC